MAIATATAVAIAPSDPAQEAAPEPTGPWQRVWWHGRPKRAPYASPLGKVHAEGLGVLRALGWVDITQALAGAGRSQPQPQQQPQERCRAHQTNDADDTVAVAAAVPNTLLSGAPPSAAVQAEGEEGDGADEDEGKANTTTAPGADRSTCGHRAPSSLTPRDPCRSTPARGPGRRTRDAGDGVAHLPPPSTHVAPPLPLFTWTTRKCVDFPAVGAGLPLVRQLPEACTDVLDDKAKLAAVARAAGLEGRWTPRTYTDAEAACVLLPGLTGAGKAPGPGAVSISTDPQPAGTPLWFVKHRRGVKGSAVTPMGNAELAQWLEAWLAQRRGTRGARQQRPHPHEDECSRQPLDRLQLQLQPQPQRDTGAPPPRVPPGDYIVQVAVPIAVWEARRFVLRVHVLVVCPPSGAPAVGYLHDDVIVLPYSTAATSSGAAEGVGADRTEDKGEAPSCPRAPRGIDKAGWVSQVGKQHPQPALAAELPDAHPVRRPGVLDAQLPAMVRDVLAAATAAACGDARGHGDAPALIPPRRCPRSSLYTLLGWDVAVTTAQRLQLLEVNSYPAIASGTMARVCTRIYTALVRDVVDTVVRPAIGAPPPAQDTGGFQRVWEADSG